MSDTSSNFEMAGVLSGKEVRKRKTPQEKIAIIQETMELGMTGSHVARLHGIHPGLLFRWNKMRGKARGVDNILSTKREGTAHICLSHPENG